jgi:hypothetical protein
MIESICFLCVIVFVYFLAWREDRQDEEAENKRADQEFDAFLEDYLKPIPKKRRQLSKEEWRDLEARADEEDEMIAKKRGRRLAKLQKEHRLIGDYLSLAGYDTPQEDALMDTLIEVEGAISAIEKGYD